MESVCMQYCIVASFRSTTEERLGTNWIRKFKKGKNKDYSNVYIKKNIHKCTKLKSNFYLDAYIYVNGISLKWSSFYLFILTAMYELITLHEKSVVHHFNQYIVFSEAPAGLSSIYISISAYYLMSNVYHNGISCHDYLY